MCQDASDTRLQSRDNPEELSGIFLPHVKYVCFYLKDNTHIINIYNV